ncbi:hypothetical protein KAW08_06835 [bacterium]|nr:hypothetical protein [bacterium]
MKRKILLFICLLILFCGVNVSAKPRVLTIQELNVNWVNYENKIVRIEFCRATDLFQLDEEIYRANIWDTEINLIKVEFKKAGLKYMQLVAELSQKRYEQSVYIKGKRYMYRKGKWYVYTRGRRLYRKKAYTKGSRDAYAKGRWDVCTGYVYAIVVRTTYDRPKLRLIGLKRTSKGGKISYKW